MNKVLDEQPVHFLEWKKQPLITNGLRIDFTLGIILKSHSIISVGVFAHLIDWTWLEIMTPIAQIDRQY